MKIGILTLFHDNYNWGGVLQGYALKTLLEKRYINTKADILIYKNGSNVIYGNKIIQAMQYSPREIAEKLKKNITSKKSISADGYLQERKKLFKEFMNEYTTNKKIYDDISLVEAANEYDCLISGSDQVWNPNVGKAGFFQTMISSQKCKKISYAASIARDYLSKYERKKMLPYIRDFDAISVREQTAKVFLDDYFNRKVEVNEVLDPVLMLSENEWKLISSKSKKEYGGNYAVAFFFSDSLEYRKEIKKYCDKKELKLYYIAFAKNEFNEADLIGEGEKLFDVGPYEFVNLFCNAKYIFTDSFHGCVFSIIFQKKFCVFERDKNNKVSKNSRLHDLMRKFELYGQLVEKIEDIEDTIDNEIDYDKIEDLRKMYQDKSFQFLDDNLKE